MYEIFLKIIIECDQIKDKKAAVLLTNHLTEKEFT